MTAPPCGVLFRLWKDYFLLSVTKLQNFQIISPNTLNKSDDTYNGPPYINREIESRRRSKMDRRTFLKGAAYGLALISIPVRTTSGTGLRDRKSLKLTYSTNLAFKDTTRLWVPAPTNATYQRLVDLEIETNASKVLLTKDDVYQAPIVYLEFQSGSEKKFAEVSFYVEIWNRDSINWKTLPSNNTKIPEDVAFYLKPTQHIQTDGIVKEYADKITKGAKTDLQKAKAIYDWVVENTFRDPKVLGCGVGDVKSMLESGYFGGKCTDINSLFVALCRASGIPAREIFGLRVLTSKLSEGISKVQGDATKAQHCRAEFYLGKWIPADPADVRKLMLEEKLDLNHPKVKRIRNFMFGGWDVHWVAFNYARDFQLKPPMSSGEFLNEFMYPVAEVEGKMINKFTLTFEYSKYTVQVL
jgi:transglutaminase-like putative cysteine protease